MKKDRRSRNSKPVTGRPVSADKEMTELLLDVKDLVKHFPLKKTRLFQEQRYVYAVNGVSFSLKKGETLGLVGESGCGKSTFAKVLMGLEKGTDGAVRHKDTDISEIAVRDRSPEQIGSLQMVFQNPFDTLNPSHTIIFHISLFINKFFF